MVVAPAPTTLFIGERAARRLIADCAQLESLLDPARPAARERLNRAMGGQLATRLVAALSGDHRMRERLLLG